MDSDSFIPQFWRATRILGLEKLTSKLIETTGITLTEKEILGKENLISWLHPITKKVQQKIYGEFAPVGGEKFLHSLKLQAQGTTEGELNGTQIRIDATDDESNLQENAVYIKLNGGERTLWDGSNRSSWIQRPSAAGLSSSTINYGAKNVKFAGSTSSESATIEHKLGEVPTAFIANADLGVPATIFVTSQTSTKTTFQVVVANALTLETTVWWAAFR